MLRAHAALFHAIRPATTLVVVVVAALLHEDMLVDLELDQRGAENVP